MEKTIKPGTLFRVKNGITTIHISSLYTKGNNGVEIVMKQGSVFLYLGEKIFDFDSVFVNVLIGNKIGYLFLSDFIDGEYFEAVEQ
jgi:hypothetical protein